MSRTLLNFRHKRHKTGNLLASMHIAVVDIATQGDLAKASASHFHTVVPFHDLLTIWFSYGQNLWNSAFRILVYSIRFPCLCIHRLSLFGRETRPFLFSKNFFLIIGCVAIATPPPPLYFYKEQRNLFVVGTGIEPVLQEWKSCVLTPRRTDHKSEIAFTISFPFLHMSDRISLYH